MSDELRAKIMEILQEQDATNVPRAADEILALFTPPATAKLPEGKTNRERAIELIDSWMVACDRLLHEPDKQRLVTMIESALTAAIAAPPVPGESKSVYDEDEHIDILVKERDAARTRISQLDADLKEAGECDRCGKPASTLCSKCEAEVMPVEQGLTESLTELRDALTAKLDPLARVVTDADLLKLADLLHLGGAKFVADCVREVARAAGGSKPA